jgi:hypothetical protein
MTFALTVHSLIDYGMDRITAGEADASGGESLYTKEMAEFIRWFCLQTGGKNNGQETD